MSPTGASADGETGGGARPPSPDTRLIAESNNTTADSQDERGDESDSQRPLIYGTTGANGSEYESFPPFEPHDDQSVKSGCGVCRVVRRQHSNSSAASALRNVLDKDLHNNKNENRKKKKQRANSESRPRENAKRKSIVETVGGWFSTPSRGRSRAGSLANPREN